MPSLVFLSHVSKVAFEAIIIISLLINSRSMPVHVRHNFSGAPPVKSPQPVKQQASNLAVMQMLAAQQEDGSNKNKSNALTWVAIVAVVLLLLFLAWWFFLKRKATSSYY